MSRYYRVNVNCKGISLDDLGEIMCISLMWDKEDLSEWKGTVSFQGTGNLCGGQSEEEAHEEIKEEILELNPNAKVNTSWTYLENLPCNDYGDNLDEYAEPEVNKLDTLMKLKEKVMK